MPKHIDAVKSLEQFRAPWETESGDDAEIDKAKLKRYIHNLVTDKAKAQDARDEAQEALTKAEADLEQAKKEAAEANGDEAQKKIDRLEKKVSDLTAERDKLVSENEEREVRAEVLGDFEAKHPKAAKYVKGTTREELEKSLEAVKEDFGITDGDDSQDDEDEPEVHTRPRNLRNPADRDDTKRIDGDVDFDKVADDILAGGGIFR